MLSQTSNFGFGMQYNFTFNGEHHLQVNGTAKGTKMAPSVANMFMGKLEQQIINTSLYHLSTLMILSGRILNFNFMCPFNMPKTPH